MSSPERDSNEQNKITSDSPTFDPNSNLGIVYAWHQGGMSRTEMKEQGILDNLQIRRAYRTLYESGAVPRLDDAQKTQLKREGQRVYYAEPQPDTNVGIVLNALRNGVPRAELSSYTGLPRSVVTSAIGQLRRVHRIDPVTPDQIHSDLRAALFSTKGSLWRDIEPYAVIGLTPREIKVAVRIEKDKDFPVDKIMYTVGKQRTRAKDERLTRDSEDKKDAANVTYNSDDVVEERVKDLLVVKTLLEAEGMEIPTRRREWRVLVEILRGESTFKSENQNVGNNKGSINLLIRRKTIIAYKELMSNWNDSYYRDWRDYAIKNSNEGSSFFENESFIFFLVRRQIPLNEIARITNIDRERVDAYISQFIETERIEQDDIVDVETTTEEEQIATNRFIRELIRAGFITENLWYWERLLQLYDHYERRMPDSWSERIKLEAFFAASLHVAVGKTSIYGEYMKAVEKSSYGFAKGEEEKFIEEKIARAVVTNKKKNS